MKKIIGIFGVAVIAMTMFLNSSTLTKSNDDLDLASLIAINAAIAEFDGKTLCSPGNTGCSTASTWCHKVTYNSTCNGG